MINDNKFSRKVAYILLFTMIFTFLPWTSFDKVKAVDIGDGTLVDRVTIGKVYDDKINQKSMYIEIYAPAGEDISLLDVKYETLSGFENLSDQTITGKRFIKFVFTQEEISKFIGRILLGESMFIDVDFNNLPNLTDVPKKIINTDAETPYYLTIKGNNLINLQNNVDGFDIKGFISKSATVKEMTNIDTKTDSEIKLLNPTPPGEYGVQNIIFTKTKITDDLNFPTIEIKHVYENQFQYVKDLVVNDLKFYPNVGAKGDKVYFEGKDLQEYDAYFLNIDGTSTFSTQNKGSNSVFEEDIDGQGTNRLTITIPDTLFIGKYNIALTKSINGEIISQSIVKDDFNNDAVFTVIDKSNKATIDTIYPTQGADLGGEVVEILGNNLINLNIEGLNVTYDQSNTPGTIINNTDLNINYPDGKYNGKDVTEVQRKISVIIGKQTLIQKDTLGDPKFILGSPDHLYVLTQKITDVENDPLADVTVIITTTFKEGTKEYKFVEIADRKDAYKFIPSSIEPIINTSTPDRVQVIDNGGKYQLNNDTLIAIDGKDFMVNRYTDGSGKNTKYPIVLIKNQNDLNEDNYVIKVDKQEDKIYYFDGVVEKTISGIEFYVLDDNDNYVTGTEGNELGTRILFKLPKEINIDNLGKKNVQILNPRKGSDLSGDTNIKIDLVDFIKVSESPVIETVNPNIVTVDGGEDIVVSGSNFHDGVKIYIDGKEVKNITRDIDIQANKIVLKFKAPKGREGTTQLQVINDDGGMDVEDFTYVKTINKDPLISTISPNMGSQNTLVLIIGDNFLKPDPSVIGVTGMGIYRLLGTRILLDNKDINIYNGTNTPELIEYSAPNIENLISIVDGKISLSSFYNNTTIKDGSNNVYSASYDSDKNILLKSKSKQYVIKLNAAKDGYVAINDSNESFTVNVALNTITINEPSVVTLNITMDNKILSVKESIDNNNVLNIADYYNSIIFKDDFGNFYTIEIDPKGIVTLSDGTNNKYTIKLDASNNIIAQKESGEIFNVVINNDRKTIIINEATPINLTMNTPYVVDSNDVIIGHRVKVLNKNQLLFTVPQLDLISKGEGWYDVTVKNPDTKYFTRFGDKGFYYYVNPSSKPEIIDIYPNQGSVDGEYSIVISGKEFEDGSKVYIDGVEVNSSDVITSIDGRYITVKVPAYQGDISKELGTDRKTVPIVVVNKDGGSASKEKGFTYVIPNSHPEIYKLTPNGGKASGGSIIEITGYDFRFFEPYKNKVGGPEYNIGDEFTDLNNNGKWDSGDATTNWEPVPLTHDIFNEYYTSPILPKVYFGDKEAKIVDFSNGYLKVIIPDYIGDGTVDVYLVNNDAGISNGLKFTYTASKPKIDAIVPGMGKMQGGDNIELIGSDFVNSSLDIYLQDGINFETKIMPLVQFGEITNRNLKIEEDYSGRINNGRALVKLTGDLDIDYDSAKKEVKVNIKYNGKTYTKTYTYDDTIKYMQLSQLTNLGDGEQYPLNELIKLEIQDKRLYVDRGFSPSTELTTKNQVNVVTPAYYTTGKVLVKLINPDTGKATTYFEYKNPGSNPQILDIEPKEPILIEGTNNVDYYALVSSLNGGVSFKITGSDFRKGVKVLIGSKEAIVVSRSDDDKEIIIKAPKGTESDLNRPLLITILNEDGAIATSKDSSLKDGKPIYYVYRGTETYPKIETITPNKGSAKGGERIVITGYDFRTDSIGDITVRIGLNEATVLINESTYKKLVVTTPSSDILGSVDVFIRNNKDFGETILEKGFTYYSNPVITGVNPYEVYITGGQEVTITGSQFTVGMKVYIGGVQAKSVTYIDEFTIKAVVPEGTEGFKDVKVVSTDGGSYTLYYGIKYILPIPSVPYGFYAKAGNERSIVLSWYESAGATRYKIFSKKHNDTDYKFIGETTKLEYYLNNLEVNTRYDFRLYAVNSYGESNGYSYRYTYTLKSSEDKNDDKYNESKLEFDIIKKSTKNTIIQLPENSYFAYSLDLSNIEEKYLNSVQINVPISAIRKISGDVSITTNNIAIRLPMSILKNSTSNIYSTKDTNVIINITKLEDRDKSSLENKLNRNQEFISHVYKTEFLIQEQRNVKALNLNGNIEVIIKAPKEQIIDSKISLVKYDEKSNNLVKLNHTVIDVLDLKSYYTYKYLKSNINNTSTVAIVKEK